MRSGVLGITTVLVDLVLPLAVFCALRAAGIGQVAALALSAMIPVVRIGYTAVASRSPPAAGPA